MRRACRANTELFPMENVIETAKWWPEPLPLWDDCWQEKRLQAPAIALSFT
jgi:hypothetical protein